LLSSKKKIKIFVTRLVFLVSSGENVILPLLATLKKYCWPSPWKISYWPLLVKKILMAPMFRGTCSSVEMLKGYTERDSWGTPELN